MRNIILTLGAAFVMNYAHLVGASPSAAAAAEVEVAYMAPDAERVRLAMTSQGALNAFVAERVIYFCTEMNTGRFRYCDSAEEQITPSVLWGSIWTGAVPRLSANPYIAPSLALKQLFRKGGLTYWEHSIIFSKRFNFM